jgi:hypothetical protein
VWREILARAKQDQEEERREMGVFVSKVAARRFFIDCPRCRSDRHPACAADEPDAADQSAASTIVVTASRGDMLGKALTASQGSITRAEVELRPIYRAGQLFEAVPGLVVTIHSGEGKAQQYLIRGYNLDHGTDFASFVDDMPVNRPTNAHGQGYSDLNFLMPQIVAGVDYTKGPIRRASAISARWLRRIPACSTICPLRWR